MAQWMEAQENANKKSRERDISMEITEAPPPMRPTTSSYTQTVTRVHGTGGDEDKSRVVQTYYETTVYTSSGGIQTYTNSHQINYLV
jgi:hypothetical protein